MISAGPILSLISILNDGGPAMSLWVVQIENVSGEEVRHILREINFSCTSDFRKSIWIILNVNFNQTLESSLKKGH